jgi:hypothetical protein
MIQSTLLLSAYDTTIYSSTNTNAITTMVFCNTATPDPADESVRAVSLEVHLIKSGKAKFASNTIIKNLNIPAGETLFFDTERVVLDNGDSILATATGTNRQISITGVSQAAQAVVTAVGHNLEAGNYVSISGVGGMTELNGNTYQVVAVLTNDTFSINVNSTGFTAYSSSGTVDVGYLAATISTLTV